MEQAWLAVGLGNPGKRYDLTRHNAGARAVERLAARMGVALRPSRDNALAGDVRVDGVLLVLARPTTFMNESGRAVAPLLRRSGIDPGHLIVLHDDIDLRPGVLRLKRGGGNAGHHGLASVEAAIGTRDFYRVRIGVGRSPWGREERDWVLERMGRKDAEEAAIAEETAADAVLAIVTEGLDRAMNAYNTR